MYSGSTYGKKELVFAKFHGLNVMLYDCFNRRKRTVCVVVAYVCRRLIRSTIYCFHKTEYINKVLCKLKVLL